MLSCCSTCGEGLKPPVVHQGLWKHPLDAVLDQHSVLAESSLNILSSIDVIYHRDAAGFQ